jgi:hypothetical protein
MTAAVVVMSIATIWGSLLLLGPSSPPSWPAGDPEHIWSFLEEVSLALFAFADSDVFTGTERFAPLPDAAEVAMSMEEVI